MSFKTLNRQLGFTLLEIITTIIVIGIAGVAILSVYTNLIRSSADPAIQQQAVTIAEAYMEEIRSKSFADPQGPELGLAAAEEGLGNRDQFDDVQDYNSLGTTEVRNQDNVAITELNAYTVNVAVTNTALNGIASANALRITVTVDSPAITPISLVSYRTNF